MVMSGFARLRVLLEGVTYKPGWKLKFEADRYGLAAILQITCTQPDTQPPHRPRPLMFQRVFDEMTLETMSDADIVSTVISSAIRDFEAHEIDEWFLFHGIHVRDPHPELRLPRPLPADAGPQERLYRSLDLMRQHFEKHR